MYSYLSSCRDLSGSPNLTLTVDAFSGASFTTLYEIIGDITFFNNSLVGKKGVDVAYTLTKLTAVVRIRTQSKLAQVY